MDINSLKIVEEKEKELESLYKKINQTALVCQEKVLNAFRECSVNLCHMAGSSGYGYEDMGKPKLCELYKTLFKAEDAIVCPQITCGTHALTLTLFGVLRPGDLLLVISGKPYDTLDPIINGENIGSLRDFGIKYEHIDMIGNEINEQECLKQIKEKKPKMVYIQRSRGYSSREALSVYYIEEIIKKVKAVYSDAIIMVDNCYGEFTEDKEPTEVGADLMAGSLIKNAGGGVAPTGGYVVGRKDLVELCAGRLTSPSLGIELGSYNASYYPFFEGIFIAPHVVAGALKGNLLLGKILSHLNIDSTPADGIIPHDIVRSIKFGDADRLIRFCQLVQKMSPIDANVVPMPWDMPGYSDKVIMAAGTFIQGSSIELSCDGPIREPYICYIQGGLTYEHLKLLAMETLTAFN